MLVERLTSLCKRDSIVPKHLNLVQLMAKVTLCKHCGHRKASHDSIVNAGDETTRERHLDDIEGARDVFSGYDSSLEDCPGYEPE